MGNHLQNYSLYFNFIEAYLPADFAEIDRNDPLIEELERLTEMNNQFFWVGDLITLKFLFCSKRSLNMLGVDPEELSPYQMNMSTHPDDFDRMGLGSANRINAAHDYLKAEKGYSILSTNLRMKNPAGTYSNLLFQCYSFYSSSPRSTVYQLQIHTNIDWYDKLKGKYHYYCGKDISKLRYPDRELLEIAPPFSDREFEILKMLNAGFSSEQIANKLYLSPHTVNTHRRNILQKTGHPRIQELLAELKEQGVL